MMTLSEAAAAMSGRLHGADRHFTGVSTDTRSLAAGELFFAIKGERYDARAFVPQALAAGAAGAVVPAESALRIASDQALVEVDDSRAALGRLAAYWRRRFDVALIAITGSSGKTTVKDMIAAILREAAARAADVLATEGNLNNDIGMPLTLLKLRGYHRYAVIEMGMNHAGEISYLTRIARPDVALVTNAGSAHIGMLGSVEAIAHAKGEIYEGLDRDGVAVVNADDAYAPLWRSVNAGRRVVDFALEAPAIVTGRYAGHGLDSDIVIQTPAGLSELRLPAAGAHNARNALAAAAVAYVLEVGPARIAAGLSAFRGPEGRMQTRPARRGATVLDDSYNANPESTLAAISVLAGLPGKRVLVFGDMGELGDAAPAAHARIGEAVRRAGIERLFTLGEASAAVAQAVPGARHFADVDALLTALESELDARTTVLVKGSRFMRMERVVQALVEERR